MTSAYSIDRYYSAVGASSNDLIRQSLSDTPHLVTLDQVPSRGYTLRATRDITLGTLIISDAPLIIISSSADLADIVDAFTRLSPVRKTRYLGLHNVPDRKREAILAQKLVARGYNDEQVTLMLAVASIFQKNAFNVDARDDNGLPCTLRAVFPTVARLNHSCLPNAHTYYNHQTNRMVVHATRPIRTEEEVLVSYFNTQMPRSDRRARAVRWDFECDCPACDVHHPQQTEHERRKVRIGQVERRFQSRDWLQTHSGADITADLSEVIQLINEEDSLVIEKPAL